jgi:hypothetical protein
MVDTGGGDGPTRRQLLAGAGGVGLLAATGWAATGWLADDRERQRFDGADGADGAAFLRAASTESFRETAVEASYVGETAQLGVVDGRGGRAGVLSTGDAARAVGDAGSLASVFFADGASVAGGAPGGSDAEDVVTVSVTVQVPEDAETLRFAYAFATEEEPGDGAHADFFAATLTGPDGEVSLASLPDGDPVTVEAVGEHGPDSGSPPVDPTRVAYDFVTRRFSATGEVSALGGEEATLSLRVGDVGDDAFDSAAFVDDLRFERAGSEEPTLAALERPPTAVAVDEPVTFAAVVDPGWLDPEAVSASASASLVRRGEAQGPVEAEMSRTVRDDGTVRVVAEFPAAEAAEPPSAGLGYEATLTVEAGSRRLADETATAFAFHDVDRVVVVPARPRDVTPEPDAGQLRAYLRAQGEYVNRFFASGLGSMGAKGFAFEVVAPSDDGHLAVPGAFADYTDGGPGAFPGDSVAFVADALDAATDEAGVSYAGYDTALVTNAAFAERDYHELSRSFWQGSPTPALRLPVLDVELELDEAAGMTPFDTAGGEIDGAYAPVGVDTWLHELAHGMGEGRRVGLPDLYDIEAPFQNFGNVADWGLMGGRGGKVVTAFCRSLGADPFADDDGWLDAETVFHGSGHQVVSPTPLTDAELGDSATFVVSAFANRVVNRDGTGTSVDLTPKLGLYVLERRVAGDADFESPAGYRPTLSPADGDGVALYRFGVLQVEGGLRSLAGIRSAVGGDGPPSFVDVQDAELFSVNYVPPRPSEEARVTLGQGGATYYDPTGATAFEAAADDPGVALRRRTGGSDSAYATVARLESRAADDGPSTSGEHDALPGVDVLAETADGRRVGIDPATGETVNEVEGARVFGTWRERGVRLPRDVDAEVSMSADRLREALRERGVEPPDEIAIEQTVLVDDDLTVEDRDGVAVLDGRVEYTRETTVDAAGDAPAIRSVGVELSPSYLESGSEYVRATVSLPPDLDASDLTTDSFVLAGVPAIPDDDPPMESGDGETYVWIDFPGDQVAESLGSGTHRPQLVGVVDGTAVRGRGEIEIGG